MDTVISLLQLLVVIAVIVGFWKLFEKAGKPGWASIVPIYNAFVMLEIAGRPAWWLVLLLIPLVNLAVAIMVNFDIAQKFGKGTGFGLGLTFLPFIFYPYLGFGNARYRGASAATVMDENGEE